MGRACQTAARATGQGRGLQDPGLSPWLSPTSTPGCEAKSANPGTGEDRSQVAVKCFEIHMKPPCLPLVAFQKCGRITRPESLFSYAFCKAEGSPFLEFGRKDAGMKWCPHLFYLSDCSLSPPPAPARLFPYDTACPGAGQEWVAIRASQRRGRAQCKIKVRCSLFSKC